MHPEMIRAIAAQQAGDRQARAQATQRARLARRARKAGRHAGTAPDPLAGIRVPDYVDGTFHPEVRQAGRTSAPADAGSGAPAVTDGADSPAPASAGGHGAPRRDAA